MDSPPASTNPTGKSHPLEEEVGCAMVVRIASAGYYSNGVCLGSTEGSDMLGRRNVFMAGWLALAVLVGQGCFLRGNLGYVLAEQHPAATLNAHVDVGYFGAGVRARVGENIQEAGAALEAGISVPEGDLLLYAYGGVNVLQAGIIDERFRFGAGSPWIEAGVGYCFVREKGQGLCATVGLDAEATLRFDPFEVEPYVGVTFGVVAYDSLIR